MVLLLKNYRSINLSFRIENEIIFSYIQYYNTNIFYKEKEEKIKDKTHRKLSKLEIYFQIEKLLIKFTYNLKKFRYHKKRKE